MAREPGVWTPTLSRTGKPSYIAIADAIAEDVRTGLLAPADRLPPQRVLADMLDLNFTTVARGYVEAQRRGLIESRVGHGTFVRSGAVTATEPPRRRSAPVDMTMNLPPEPDDPALVARMQRGLVEVGRDLVALLRYQEFGGSEEEKQAGVDWLARRGLFVQPDRLLVCPGAHAALFAVMATRLKRGDLMAAEALTYPGLRAMAAQLGLELAGLAMDDQGVDPEALAALCAVRPPKLLYLNPTMLNPTAATIPLARRHAIAAICRRHGITILEDDAYGLIPTNGPAAFATIAPELTFYVSGLAKCLGAGLRVAYLAVPDAPDVWPLSAAMRAPAVMASPITVALATRWIIDGTADDILAAIRTESNARQRLAADILPAGSYRSTAGAFHLWVPLPAPWSRSSFVSTMRTSGIGIVASDAFAVHQPPPEAVRVCLGGVADRPAIKRALERLAHALVQSPAMASAII